MGAPKAFLDAGILFSAALGGPLFDLLWEFGHEGKVILVSSPYCQNEAERNLRIKRSDRLPEFGVRMRQVRFLGNEQPFLGVAAPHVVDKDAPVLAGALGAHADFLITGDLKHFGHLMTHRHKLPLRVVRLRLFLESGLAGR